VGVNGGRILIADASERFRAFASDLVRRAGFAASEVMTAEAAVAAAREERPALVLLDVSLPDLSGFEVCRQLREEFGEDLPIVFVSDTRVEPLDRAAGLLIGGDDYVVKPVDPDELLARMRRLISRSDRGGATSPLATRDVALTPREQEILQLMAEGMGSKEIAQMLVISPKTVSSHIQSVIGKLGVHSRAEAVATAYREGLVTLLVAASEHLSP
jgi:DNA-binding NarL/FixJ family response regulator